MEVSFGIDNQSINQMNVFNVSLFYSFIRRFNRQCLTLLPVSPLSIKIIMPCSLPHCPALVVFPFIVTVLEGN